MSRAQRPSFLAIAAVIAVVAVVLLTSGSATATPTPTATPKPPPSLLQTGKVAELRFKQGDTVRFRVRSDTDEEIHVHGDDREESVPAGETVTGSFPAEITGIFEIEFHGSGELIGQLRADPD